MVERVDPARTGVKAGRVVGVVTALIAVASLWTERSSAYRGVNLFLDGIDVLLTGIGIEFQFTETVILVANVGSAVVVRYTISYVVGSLLGVVYDWLDRPSVGVLVGCVTVVGVADGALAALDTRSLVVGCAYLLAWWLYVPVFLWLFDPDADSRDGPVRLGD